MYEDTYDRPLGNFPTRVLLISDYPEIQIPHEGMYEDEVCFYVTDYYGNDAVAGMPDLTPSINVEFSSQDGVLLNEASTNYTYFDNHLCIIGLRVDG